MDENELSTLKQRTAYFGIDKIKDFDDFRQKYLKLPANADTIDLETVLQKPIKSNDKYFDALLTTLNDRNVGYNPVKNHSSQLTNEEIISVLSGGDRPQAHVHRSVLPI